MSSKALVPTPVPHPPAVPEPPALDAFLDKHFRQIVIAVGVLIVLMAAYGALRYHNHQEAEAAAIEATQAKTVDDCDLAIQHHPGSVAAGTAVLTKAKLLWDQNKKDTSVAALRDFVQKYPDHPFHVQGMISLGTRLEAMGSAADVAEAKKLYEQIVSEGGKSDLAGLAQLRLSDMLWNQGKEAEAKKIYESLPSKLTGSPFFDQNEERLKWLVAGLPTKEIEGPKPPPEPPAGIKAPAGGLNSVKSGSALDKAMSGLQKAVPNAKITPANPKPTAIPAPATLGKPAVTPGSASPGVVVPAPAKPPATATTPPVQAPAPKPAAAPAAATPAPASAAPAAPATPPPAPDKK